MAQTADPVFGINYGWDLGSDGWKAGMDYNLAMIACMMNPLVLSKVTTTPPSSPLEYSKYIIPAGATGVWLGKTNVLAVRFGGKWNYVTPVKGMRFMLDNVSVWTEYGGTAWS